MKKYIVVEVEIPEQDYEDDYPEDVDVKTRQFSLPDLLKDPEFRDQLMKGGWVDVENIDQIKSPNGLGPRVIIFAPIRSTQQNVTGMVIDLKNSKGIENNIRYYGNKPLFAIEVTAEVMGQIAPDHLAAFQKVEAARVRAEKAAASAEEKRKAKQAEAQKKKTQKKIDDAKKLLEKQGLKVIAE